jgi:hypothetical protein
MDCAGRWAKVGLVIVVVLAGFGYSLVDLQFTLDSWLAFCTV